MYLEGDGQAWKAVEDRACMKFCTYESCGKEARKDYGEVFRPQGSRVS